ncbi:MAG: VCBS repeat-containing protein [Thermodesulfovibrionales bacterium]|nr:VCBS repeat-containing protein [Thermodesulfovibrionales bacterium]
MRKNVERMAQNRKWGQRLLLSSILVLLSVICCLVPLASYADDNPLSLMRDDVLSYFSPLKGKVVSVNNGMAVINIGERSNVKKGMRFIVFREGAPFLHPVTKAPIGTLEAVIGKAEIKEAGHDTSTAVILKGDVKVSDKVRISETGVRMLFYQGKNVDWSLGDSYYRLIKETGRFEIVDTAIETDNDSEVMAEAKRLNADVVLILSAKEAAGDTMLKHRLLWADNAIKFAEDEVRVAVAFMKELRFGEEFFGPQKGDVRTFVDLPFGVRLITAGDIDGDGKAELLMSTGSDIRLYSSGAAGDLSGLYEIKGTPKDDHIWLDVLDINRDSKDEVIRTLMTADIVVSRIYEFKDGKFFVLWEGDVFLKRIGNELIAQEYERGEGYKGAVFKVAWDNGYKKGDNVSIPRGVNIYDFIFINEPVGIDSQRDGKRLALAYDDAGHLNLYDEGIRIWRSKGDYGGFQTTFKRVTPTIMVERGEWAVKDRLVMQNREILVIKRIPLVGMAKGIGYSKSQIRSLWWTGVSMEERTIIDDIPGKALDYTIADNRIIVLDMPMLGIKFKNILKGENPIGTALYIYPLKGR